MHQENQLTVETAKRLVQMRWSEAYEVSKTLNMNERLLRWIIIYDELETVFLLAKPEYSHVSSSILKKYCTLAEMWAATYRQWSTKL